MTLCVNRSNVLVMFNLCFYVQVHVYLYSWGLRMSRAQPKSPQCLIYKLCTAYIKCRGKQVLRHSIITTSYTGLPWLPVSPLPVVALGLPLLLQFSPFQQEWL